MTLLLIVANVLAWGYFARMVVRSLRERRWHLDTPEAARHRTQRPARTVLPGRPKRPHDWERHQFWHR